MMHQGPGGDTRKKGCLNDEALYAYISCSEDAEGFGAAEVHFAECPVCRRNLAALLGILHPEGKPAEAIAAPTTAELNQTVAAIREIAQKESARSSRYRVRFTWPVAAAAAIAFAAISLFAFKYLYERSRSEEFFRQAQAILEQGYTGTSPSNLRLALPFHSLATDRKAADDSLRAAENFLFQALAFRENMIEAHLGLAYVYLRDARYAGAKEEFQRAVDMRPGDIRARLGRGVAIYEEAVRCGDPFRREALLKSALADFEAVMKASPDSREALYNKARTLFESGRHKEAASEIDRYLSRDPGSLWAEGLKELKTRSRALF